MPLFERHPGIWQAGNPRRPELVLIHGWGGTGPSNFRSAVDLLAGEWHVTAVDLPGHGRGPELHPPQSSVAGLAASVAGQLATAGVGPATVLGYSLGGAVAQQLWRDHPERVEGLVLAATASRLSPTPVASVALRGWAGTHRLTGGAWGVVGAGMRGFLRLGANRGWDTVNLSGIAEHDGPAVQLLGASIAAFDSRGWIGEVDVPVAVVATLGDRLVPTSRQMELAKDTRAVEIVPLPGGHLGFLRHPETFAAGLRQGCRSVAAQRRGVAPARS